MREQFGNWEAERVNMAVHVCLSERFLPELRTKELKVKCSDAESHTFDSTLCVCVCVCVFVVCVFVFRH